ncbi:interferon gamma receptor 1 isoform X2 [Oncorhynchus kisutch]|uniref:Interferon/interleukin receptor domain-containing protein n=1 Tax=Oncorhynchus kisutch TaxID=8019 RepID=A0A8C7C3U1_ONCKI|nr:interferon gamma receptor 1 isoform X2 [Oncorhynchus kisutch]
MMLAFCGSLTFLMVLVTAVSTLVPPPENVTVSCNNFQTTVYWNYSELLRQPLFKLKINSDLNLSFPLDSTKQHHYDLSPFIWNAKELDRYFVTITASDETEESASLESSIFTFSRDLTADIKCKLDFPAVKVSMKDMEVTVSFDNPYHLYTELKESHIREDDKHFLYHVTYENTEGSFKCQIKDKVCRHHFTVRENKEQYCVSLEGNAMSRKVMFSRIGPICGDEDKTISLKSSLLMLLPLIIIGIVAFVVFVTIRLCKRSMRKRNLSNFPKTLASILSNPHDKNIMQLQCEIIAPISGIEPATTTSQSMLETSEEEEPTTNVGFSSYLQYPISSGQVGEGLFDRRSQLWSELLKVTQPCSVLLCGDDDSEESDSRTLEVEDMDSPASGYDTQHIPLLEVEMSAGDVVVHYGST